MKNDVMVLDNKIIEAKTDIKSSEALKIFSYVISNIKKNDESFQEINVYIPEYKEITSSQKKYKQIKEVGLSMLGSSIFIISESGYQGFTVFRSIKYIANEGLLKIKLNDDMKPFLLQLGANFTKLYFNNISKITSSYAIRIYGLLKRKNTFKKAYFDLKDLQEILQCPKSYKNDYKAFRQKVLAISIKEINAKTDIEVYKVSTEKTVRKITSIIIYFREKNELNLTNLQAFIKSFKII
jgi:plasmid replication initiation protein